MQAPRRLNFRSLNGKPFLLPRFTLLLVVLLAMPVLVASAATAVGDTVLISKGYDPEGILPYVIGDGISNFASSSWYGEPGIQPRVAYASRAKNILPYYPPLSPDEDCYMSGSQEVCFYDIYVTDPTTGQVESLTIKWDFDVNQDGDSFYPTVSHDGKYVVFQSATEGWGGTENWDTPYPRETDIFLVDVTSLSQDTLKWRISAVSGGGEEPDADSGHVNCQVFDPSSPPLCARHTYIPYGPTIPNFLYGHPVADLYSTGNEIDDVYVAYESLASNLTGEDKNGYIKDIFLTQPKTNASDVSNILLSRGCRMDGGTVYYDQPSEEYAANGDSYHPVFLPTDDPQDKGRYLAFVSRATNLDCAIDPADYPPDDPAAAPHLRRANVFLLDRDVDEDGIYDEFSEPNAVSIRLISKNMQTGLPGNGASEHPAVSHLDAVGDYYIAFQSSATNLVSNDPNGYTDIFLYGKLSGQYGIKLISLPSKSIENPGAPVDPANLSSYSPAITANGRIITFTSYATNLIDGDTNEDCDYTTGSGIEGRPTTNCPDIFARDWSSEQTWRVSITSRGQQAGGNSNFGSLSGTGQFVFFASAADMEAGGTYTKNMQVYMRDQGNPPGNPNVQPTSWHYQYLPPGSTSDKVFYIRFLAPLRVDNITVTAGMANYSLVADNCSGSTIWDNPQTCSFTVRFTAPLTPTDQVEGNVQLSVYDPTFFDARTLNFALSGGTMRFDPQILTGPDPLEAPYYSFVEYEIEVRNGGNIVDDFDISFNSNLFPMSVSEADRAKLVGIRPRQVEKITVRVTIPNTQSSDYIDNGVLRVTSLGSGPGNVYDEQVISTGISPPVVYLPLVKR